METQSRFFWNEFEKLDEPENTLALLFPQPEAAVHEQPIPVVFKASEPKTLWVLRFPDPALDD